MAKASSNGRQDVIDRLDAAYDARGFPPVLLSGDIARMLNCSVSHVWRLVSQKAFPVLGDRPVSGKPIRAERRAVIEYMVLRS